ncbi:hypothetical protein GDO78_021778 [Eleutherodactylus coqui]|uniref:Ephrin-A1 n=1 Tax=Eleutherodactylus coqui TaxID=57060 RepID=A0A8J6EN79_ELECQ|nr:hypothetical protein GDO78_021778 [Eleutherodactylus coqui]
MERSGCCLLLLLHWGWAAAADVHTVYWNSTNRRFWDDYTIQVQLNDYLDIVCPHYEDDRVAGTAVEKYTLFLVDHEEYVTCKPVSKNQVCWECSNPFNLNGPEKFREKFQKFTAFSRGKEFKEGHSYYYICKELSKSCLQQCLIHFLKNSSRSTGLRMAQLGHSGCGELLQFHGCISCLIYDLASDRLN